MDHSHLTSEEVDYELALRHVLNLSRTTHRGKVIRLKALIEQESLSDMKPTSSEHVMSALDNINVCQTQLDQLHLQTEAAILAVNTADMYELRSRIIHYQNRLRLINPPVELNDTYTLLVFNVEDLYKKVCDALSVNSDQNDSAKHSLPKSTGTRRKSTSPEDGAAGGFDTSDISPFPPTDTPESHQRLANNGGRGRGRKLVTPNSPEGHHSILFGNNRSTLQQEHQAQQDRSRANQDSTDYHRLRDGLLNHLLQIVRVPPARADERRMLKAVHNWPFKFRGEKDTTSLNVFLDRVETFARSEGMNDETLLSSIKHLLHEDALEWYARATLQNRLLSWRAFKQEIRKEFLPSGYSQILRLEASFRFQGVNESFAKYYRDISALFRFVEPPIPENEKLFTVKKNMNADYAAIVTAARPQTLDELVDICTSYDETRMLLNRQRRVPIPHTALLEPNFATPMPTTKPTFAQQQSHRLNRVHAVEKEEFMDEELSPLQQVSESQKNTVHWKEEVWQNQMDELLEQVNALKMSFDKKNQRSDTATQSNHNSRVVNSFSRSETDKYQQFHHQPREPATFSQLQWTQRETIQEQLPVSQQRGRQSWHADRINPTARGKENIVERRHDTQQPYEHHLPPSSEAYCGIQRTVQDHQRHVMTCWNCDEEGHRFMDCPKPQAILFCYRCGRKGYSLRSCFTCRTDAGNQLAENEQ
ncbi:uncharacterized protein LOC131438957 [Malaya genurostris]|uniref:uncharacterized protein LOC131438957 n=1 Tax=Malaya genurostris TaxID=325434 RepID=UPI0026F382EB|nr:uncharacterized protein LOC131438957 [Malaya genurostris]XP_058465381.1 uncharacterized protein LOC131438957 [Malaya genurostris]